MTKITYESTEELGHSIPLSKREIEEDILEELCSLAKKDALIGISEICGRMKMSRREVLACLKQLTARLRKNRRKKHLRLPHRAGTDPGRGMPPPP